MRRPIRTLALAVAVSLSVGPAVVTTASPTPASATVSHQLIQGSGSTWAQNAVEQWISDVQQYGLKVVFTGVGSAQGRKDFANSTTDFAVSDIGFQGHDPLTGESDTSNGRAYAYEPIVAGGTAFPYQILVGGQKVTNLRLSGLTLAKIFTNQITNWDDPEITSDNNGRQLPSIPIIPVVDSQGAGTTAQFTTWLAAEYPALWKAFSGEDVETEYWPRQGAQISQPGSNGIMNFVTSAAANGSIGMAEYSYAVNALWPVAKIENQAGYFTAPTQYNVAVALTQAQINMDRSSPDYLLQNLDQVYVYNDPRTYPLSSYSYVIIPTGSSDSTMNTAKRQTLADYLSYAVCQGQAEIGPVGYSPLPVNLVQASFQQTALLQQADPNVTLANDNVASCHNPTFVPGQPNNNYLAQIAPMPPSCDQAGQGPCNGAQGLTNGNPQDGKPTAGPSPTSGPSASSAASPSAGAAPSSGPSAAGSAATVAPPAAGSRAVVVSGPATASSLAATSTATAIAGTAANGAQVSSPGSSSSQAAAALVATPTVLGADHPGGLATAAAGAVAIFGILALISAPTVYARVVSLRRRRRR